MAGYNTPKTMNALETYNTNPDTIVITYDSGNLEGVTLVYPMASVLADLRCDGYNLDRIPAQDWVYLYDDDAEVGEFVSVTHVAGTDILQHTSMPTTRLYPAGTKVIKINRIKFFVDQSNTDHPTLMLQTYGSMPAVFAENIIALNFRYFLENGSIVTQTASPGSIRMVEIDVVGRTDAPDSEFAENYRTRNFNLRVKVRNLAL